MNILLTGSRGFIGTHVRKRLIMHNVEEVDCFEPRVHGDDAHEKLWDHIEHPYSCSLVPPEAFADTDVLVHLAAQVGVADSWDDPRRYYDYNTSDTFYLMTRLRLAVEAGAPLKRIVVASSMSVYGDPGTSAPITEEHPVRPASIYGLTKFDQEQQALIYGELLGIDVIALRFFNVFGPGQALSNPYTGVLAIFANHLLRGERPPVYEDGFQTRDFIYVGDVADVVCKAVEGSLSHGVYNVCTGRPQTIRGVAEELAGALASDLKPDILGETRKGDIRHCIGSNMKLRAELPEWRPRSFFSGLMEYAEWLVA